MEFSVIFLTFSLTWILSQSAEEMSELLSTDICQNSGKQLVCGPGRIVRIGEVLCLPNNYTCPERQRIINICDGQNSCASLGIKNQIWSYCKGFTYRTVLITYRCVRDVLPPPCRTNLCSDESEGMFCKPGNIIHIRNAFCTDPDTEYTWKIIHTLYILCEGRTSCFASGLRIFMPNATCLNALPQNANLFVDYICIPESLSNDLCTGQMLTLHDAFGIIKSPGFPANPYGNRNGCFWAVVPGRSQLVEVTIHIIYSRDVQVCGEKFVQITYTDCRTNKVKNEHYCVTSNANIVRKSCGAFYVRNAVYPAGESHGNRFVISYQVLEYRSLRLRPAYAPFMTQCSSLYSLFNATSVGPYTTRDGKHFLVNDGVDNSTDEVTISSFDPERFLSIFKIVVINFFLFVIAFWLVIALCLVCCRYCKLSKTGQYKLALQSDTDSGHSGRRTDPGGTSMQTFSEGIEESPEQETCFNHIEKRNAKMYTSVSSDGPYSSVSKPSYYTDNVFPSVGNSNTEETSNRTSSFRPYKVKNPYASYDSLDFNEPDDTQPDNSNIMQTSTISKATVDEFPPPPPPELLDIPPRPPPPPPLEDTRQNQYRESYPNDNITYQNGANEPETEVTHYTINDDDYAIVQKPKRKPQNVPNSNQAHNPMYGHVPPSASDRTTSPYDNQARDVDLQPQQLFHSPKRQQTGYLPQHHCMLECDGDHPHNFPPPPAQINRQRINGSAYPVNTPRDPNRTDHYY